MFTSGDTCFPTPEKREEAGRMGTSSGSPPAGPIQQPQKFQYGGKRECTTIQMHGVPSRCGRCIDSRSATGRPGSESYAPSQGLAVATRATEKELNKYPGKKNIVLVYRTIIYVYDIRAVELIECPRRRNWVPSGSPLPPRLAMPSRSFPCARDELSAGQPQCR